MSAGANVRHGDHTAGGGASDPRSHVGNSRSSAADARRGQWRRPHAYHTPRQRLASALWWVAVATLVAVGVVYAVRQI
jgi:hypothetical protein